jgi:hypothetical protein
MRGQDLVVSHAGSPSWGNFLQANNSRDRYDQASSELASLLSAILQLRHDTLNIAPDCECRSGRRHANQGSFMTDAVIVATLLGHAIGEVVARAKVDPHLPSVFGELP